MDPLTIGLLGGAGLGIGKGLLDQQKEKRDRQVAAEMARWSPWTGMKPEMPKGADMLGSAMQGGMSGAMLGQGMANQNAYQNYLAQNNVYGAAPVASAAQPGHEYLGTDAGFAGGPMVPQRRR